jgi:hypothetical protein
MVWELVGRAWDLLQARPARQGFVLVVGGSVLLAKLLRSIHPPLYVTVALAGGYVGVRLLDVAGDDPFLVEDPPPRVRYRAFGDSAVARS